MAKSPVLPPRLLGRLHEVDPDALTRVAARRSVTLDPDESLLHTCRSLITPTALTHHLRQLDASSLEILESLRAGTPVSPDNPQVGALVDDLLLDRVDSELHLTEGVADALVDCDAATALRQQALPDPPKLEEDQLRQHSLRTIPVALGTISRLESLLEALQATLAHEVILSGPAWARALERRTGVDRGEFAAVSTLAMHAGLAVEVGGLVLLGPGTDTWRHQESAGRWAECIRAWWEAAPPGAQAVLRRWPQAPADASWWSAAVRTELPLDPGESLAPWLHSGVLLGVFDGSQPTLWGRTLGDGQDGSVALHALASTLLPTPVTTVYPEGVSSLLAPGLPSAALDQTLRLVARAIPRGLTTVYTITPASVLWALEHGHTADSLLQALEPLIIGGVPVGLHDLILRIGSTAPLLTLSPDPLGGTLLTVSDSDLCVLLQVDRSLHVLSLEARSDFSLHTRAPLAETQSALLTAGYPSLGPPVREVTTHPRSVTSPLAEDDSTQRDAAHAIVQAAREAKEKGETPWLEDILLLAVASREPLDVCVSVDGVVRWFSVEPTSVHQGRLRVRDLHSDVERTLPLRSVVEVRPAGHGGSPPA